MRTIRLIGVAAVIASLLVLPAPENTAAPPTAPNAATCTAPAAPAEIVSSQAAPAGLPGFHAWFVKQSGHPTLCPGQTATLSVTYQNSGNQTWPHVKLGTWNPIPGENQPSVLGVGGRPAVQTSVGPGAQTTLAFSITAPTSAGVYRLYVRPLIEGLLWLEDWGTFFQVTVLKDDGTATCSTSPTVPDLGPPPQFPSGLDGFHAAWAGQSGHPTLCPGQPWTFQVKYRNVGNRNWTKGGAEARLGTTFPDPGQDRPSVLLGSSSTGWPFTTRVGVQGPATVQPGEEVTFQFSVLAPLAAGVYRIHVRPLIEGVLWMEDHGVFVQVTVTKSDGSLLCTSSTTPANIGPVPNPPAAGTPGYHAGWMEQSGYPELCPGQAWTLTMRFRNLGDRAWTQGSAEARLGTSGPTPGQDRMSALGGVSSGWPFHVRAARQSAATVNPGQDVTFEVKIIAPLRAGKYSLFVRPLIEGITWMEDYGANWRVTVLNSDGSKPCGAGLPGYHAAWTQQSAHLTLMPDQSAALNVKYCNSGSRDWRKGVPGEEARLGTWGPMPGQDQPSGLAGAGWLAGSRPAVQGADVVTPGETATFEFQVKAPTSPGVYRVYVRPLIEGVVWLEDHGVFFQVTVKNPDGTLPCSTTSSPAAFGPPPQLPGSQAGYHATWLGQSGHVSLCPGQEWSFDVTYKNVGTLAWALGGPEARLGTTWPEPGQDRLASLMGGVSTGWAYGTRPAVQSKASVAPGDTVTFQFKVLAPPAPGVYRLYVRPLIEGITWMEDQGTFFQVTVLKNDLTTLCQKDPGLGDTGTPPADISTLPVQSGYHAGWWGQTTIANSVCPGQTLQLKARFVNTGTETWRKTTGSADVRLGTAGPAPGFGQVTPVGGASTGWPFAVRPARLPEGKDAVASREFAEFAFTVIAPTKPGIYWLFVAPLAEGVTWMEGWDTRWRIVVTNQDGSDPKIACGSDCWPLFGVPHGGGNVGRRGLNVKIDNAGSARPHYGISQADMIWETLIDSFNITRLNAIFHSRDAGTVGSVRSARLVDRYVTPALRGGLAYAGTTIEEQDMINLDASQGKYLDVPFNKPVSDEAYYRVGFRSSPYNLFTSTQALRSVMAAARNQGGCPTLCTEPVAIPAWGFLAPGAESAGMLGSAPANYLRIPYPSSSYVVEYRYDGGAAGYARWQAGVREVDAANGALIFARNVVVIYTDVWSVPEIVEDRLGSRAVDMCLAKDAPLYPSSNPAKPASCSGTGPVSIFVHGQRQDGTWTRNSINDAFTFTNRYGETIHLQPGQTWVHVVPKTWAVGSN